MKRSKNTKTLNASKKIFRNPVLCILLAVLGASVCENVAYGIMMIAEEYISYPSYIATAVTIVAVSLYVLWVKKKIGNGFVIGIRFDNLGKALVMCSATLIVIVYSVAESAIVFLNTATELSGIEFFNTMMNQILYGTRPGVIEEYTYRVLMMGIIMHLLMGKKHRLALAVGVSSLVFGLLHLVNLSHAPLGETVYQTVYAAAIGLLFAAAYARTRNILAPMIVHSVIDFTEGFYVDFYPGVEVSLPLKEIVSLNAAYAVVIVLSLAIGLYMLRPSKHHEIEQYWGSLAVAEE